jgi:hypothetical protein
LLQVVAVAVQLLEEAAQAVYCLGLLYHLLLALHTQSPLALVVQEALLFSTHLVLVAVTVIMRYLLLSRLQVVAGAVELLGLSLVALEVVAVELT